MMGEEEKESNATICGPYHRPTSERSLNAFLCQADDGPTLNAGFAAL